MVFLLTDAGEYREVAVPSTLTIGRAPTNNIRPESPSVSKKHAILTLSYIPNTSKVEAWVEDLESRNGTYAGPTLLDIERIQGKAKIHLGDYIRFGYAQKFFQLLENIPRDVEPLPAEIVVSPSKEFQQDAQKLGSMGSDVAHAGSDAVALTARGNFDENLLPPPNFDDALISSSMRRDQQAPSIRSSPGERSRSSYISRNSRQELYSPNKDQFGDPIEDHGIDGVSPRNMRISVDYPTTGGSLQHPVSITIDPPNQQSRRSGCISQNSGGRGSLVSPVAEELDEFDRSAESRNSLSNSNRDKGGNRWLDSMRHDGTDRVRFQDSGTNDVNGYVGTSTLGSRSMTGTINTKSHIDNLHLRPESLDEIPVTRIDRSHTLDSNKTSEPRRQRDRSPTKVIDAIDQLDALSKRSTDANLVARHSAAGIGTDSIGRADFATLRDSDPSNRRAIYSSYYLDKPRGILKSSINSAGSSNEFFPPSTAAAGGMDRLLRDNSLIDQMLADELMKHNDNVQALHHQANIGSDELESKKSIPIVRRSWPQELTAPSSDMIARFIDLLLANEAGTTQREYELYQEIQEGRDKKKRKNDDRDPPDESKRGSSINCVSLSELQINPIKCIIPSIIPTEVMTEAAAESFIETGIGNKSAVACIGQAITAMNNLLRQCLRGASIDSSTNEGNNSAEFDRALQGVISSIIHQGIQLIRDATDCGVIRALEKCNDQPPTATGPGASSRTTSQSEKVENGIAKVPKLQHPWASPDELSTNIGLLLQQSIDTLTRINSFLLGNYLAEQALNLKVGQVYEIASLAISAVLNKLDACIVAIGSINHRVDEVTVEHIMAQGGGFQKTSLSLELEELRRLKRETELTPLVERIRQQEANILEKKISKFNRVFDLLFKFQMRSVLLRWRSIARAMKQHEMALHDLQERVGIGVKRSMFREWHHLWKEKSRFRKVMHRFARIAGGKGQLVMRLYFQRWSRFRRDAAQDARSGAEVAQLRLELCNIKAAMHDLTNSDQTAAALAAERALNRELSAVNLELRQSLQRSEAKLLECAAVPASKRKDLVNNFLLQKDNEIAEVRRENEFLHNEVDQKLREVEQLQTKRKIIEKKEADIVSNSHAKGNSRSFRGKGGAYTSRRGNLSRGPSSAPRIGGGSGKSVRAAGFGMSKEMALDVILFEVKRLKTSLSQMQQQKKEMNEKVVTETHRNVQLTMAVQSLESRITAMERSATALRELLRQKLGDQGLLHLIGALENLGAGSNVLLDNAVSSTAVIDDAYESNDMRRDVPESSITSLEDRRNFRIDDNERSQRNSSFQRHHGIGDDSNATASRDYEEGSKRAGRDSRDSRYLSAIDSAIYR